MDMRRDTVLVTLIFLIGSMGAFAPVSSAQAGIFPEVNLTCEEPTEEMEVSPGATRTVLVNCKLENPTSYNEQVDITIQAGPFAAAGPQSATVASNSELDFQVVFRGEETQSPGQYPVNITAKVVQANGIDVSLFTSEESVEVMIEVAAFVSCQQNLGQGGGTLEAGQLIVFSTSISCTSNEDSTAKFRLVMISDTGDSSWPSGFVDQSATCEIQIQAGSSSNNCQFQITTPSNLADTWEGCIVVLEQDWDTPDSCPSYRIDIKVEPKTIGIGTLELTGNNSIFGEYEEEAPIIIGGVAVVLVLTILVVVIRRRRRSFDD